MRVGTALAEPRVFQADLEILGELRPKASVDVTSRVSGQLESLLVERGDAIQRGQLLAEIDDSDLQERIRRSEAGIAVARAAVQREQATLRNLQVLFDRYQNLHEEALISTQELEDVESRLRVAEAEYQLAQAQVEQAEADLRELRIQQEQTRILSPLDGFVGERVLDPGAQVNASTPIVSVLDVSRLKTVIPVPERVLPQIRPGLSAVVTVDPYPDRRYTGGITSVSPFLDAETRTADVEIEVDNSEGVLKPGMFARVQIEATIARTSLSIPRAALLTRGDQKGVYLLSEDDTAIYRTIEIGKIEGQVVEVLEGLSEGTRVVSAGAQNLNEGDKVRRE